MGQVSWGRQKREVSCISWAIWGLISHPETRHRIYLTLNFEHFCFMSFMIVERNWGSYQLPWTKVLSYMPVSSKSKGLASIYWGSHLNPKARNHHGQKPRRAGMTVKTVVPWMVDTVMEQPMNKEPDIQKGNKKGREWNSNAGRLGNSGPKEMRVDWNVMDSLPVR
jgi:hypothetical protein